MVPCSFVKSWPCSDNSVLIAHTQRRNNALYASAECVITILRTNRPAPYRGKTWTDCLLLCFKSTSCVRWQRRRAPILVHNKCGCRDTSVYPYLPNDVLTIIVVVPQTAARQDQHGRVRHGFDNRDVCLPSHQKPKEY